MTDKQLKFCNEYLVDMNATQAAIRAGYSAKAAADIGMTNLRLKELKQYILEAQMKDRARLDITKERVLEEYRRIAFGDTKDFFDELGNLIPIHELSDEAQASISSVEIEDDGIGIKTKKIKRWEKTKALEALGKHLGLFEADNNQKKMVIKVRIDDEGI